MKEVWDFMECKTGRLRLVNIVMLLNEGMRNTGKIG